MTYNKSKTYLLPLLSEFVKFDKKFYPYLQNTYIFDDLGKFKNAIFVEHDFSFKNPEFTLYENNFTETEYFLDLIDITPEKVLYIFKFPDDYINEYELFKKGKYSHYDEDAKELILSFFAEMYEHNIGAVPFLVKIKQILFKDEKLKREIEDRLNVKLPDDAELTDAINNENEVFELSKYITKIRLN